MKNRKGFFTPILLLLVTLWSGCAKQEEPPPPPPAKPCAPASVSAVITGNVGKAYSFLPDPIASSGNLGLAPNSTQLDEYRSLVDLSHLTGKGVLSGKYVDVINGLQCDWNYGAFDLKNQFLFSHSDPRFQETMAYYVGNSFRNDLDQSGYLQAKSPVIIVAHCDQGDNSSFARITNTSGEIVEVVCLYDSVRSPGAFYSDDGMVIMHELQHAATGANYSFTQDFDQFDYDEAGALNEGISDFMSLIHTDSILPASVGLDRRIFSRWALGTFIPPVTHARGAHLCPIYDSQYPECTSFPKTSVPLTSDDKVTLSYVYPDGLGWPYPNYFSGASSLKEMFLKYSSQEEIHSNDIIPLGALWDVYDSIKSNHGGNIGFAKNAMVKLTMEAVRQLPMPDEVKNHSPITFIGFFARLIALADQTPELSSLDRTSIRKVLALRGLYGYQEVSTPDWLTVGDGTNENIASTPTQGVYLLDDPQTLRRWLKQKGKDQTIIKQGLDTGINGRLDPGEVAVIWFDLQNNSDLTVGGVLVNVTSTDPAIQIIGSYLNKGYMTQSGPNQAQIMYAKINGTSIVDAFSPVGSSHSVPLGNTYFRTNPFFNYRPTTGIWVKALDNAPHGKTVDFEVSATPSNGVASAQYFSVTIN